ncbi:SusC/RagA family TonB-linked outer membrane protein [Flavobacterium sp.]|uniref:SusC/RagA family TonB-linked outer membrane protein n=1 Tax=Flavobacterium sp. TaxID=239 RepID=UPI0008D0A682|nr:SusC/RagA family TonB-linked outer membrane protein [Flavobacterium sp.]OGS61213.1 MAG: SusC/RagA family TonB-linked outer membrane protein [Flavobacteria bacterium GWF1_32_7]HBD27054.1 SusC/RagA family TonB-linked outer membrane protein [Flavobacterium sp.]
MKTLQKKLLLLLLMLPLGLLAQNTLKGVVLDGSSKQTLPGVNVLVAGTTNGVTTDFDGNFTLTNIKKGDRIVFSYIGFKDETITYENQNTITITLQEDQKELKDVVVIGYGTVKKKDATGSVTSITSSDFNKGANVTVDNLLTGKVAGVTINSNGGSPGSVPTIRIRGGSSLLANNDPLVVLDGLPMDSRVLATLNPSDVESFTILKDASATAIYGTRASNGVIIITTKKGSKELQVDYNVQYGTGKKVNKIDVLSADQFRQVVNNLYPVGPSVPNSAFNQGVRDKMGNANTDWQEEIYRRTDYIDNNLSIKGNFLGLIPTRLTIANTYQEGIRLTDYMNRNNVSLNLSPSFFGNHLKTRMSLNYTNTNRRNAPGVEGGAIAMDPTQPVYDPTSPFDGFFEFRDGPTINDFAPIAVANPVAQLLQTNNRSENYKLFGNFEVDYKFHFLPELRWVTNLGYDRDAGNSRNFTPITARTSPIRQNALIGNNSYSDGVSTNKLIDSYLVYNKTFNDLTFDVTGGYSYQIFEGYGYTTRNQNNADDIPQSTVNDDIVYVGFFGRTNFTYKDKYLLTLSYRRDGTSRFSDSNRWGNFPAASLAWKLKEDFFKENKIISELKLRAGWGVTGQQDIGAGLFYLPQYYLGDQNSQYAFDSNYFNVAQPGGFNPNLKWEETTTYNAGVDFGIKDNRLNGSLDFFYKVSDDLFQVAPFADGSNFTNEGPQNIGSMSVKGFELNINYDVLKQENLNWNVNFNASKFERRIDEIAGGVPIFVGNIGIGTESQIMQEGFTPNSFYVFKQLYNNDGSPIEGAFADLNGDGLVNNSDRYIYKNIDPNLILGFSTSFNYKNFDLGFNLRASFGNRILNVVKSRSSYYNQILNGELQNLPSSVLDYNFNTPGVGQILSDLFVENGSFLRMDYATFGYTFPKWLEGKASLRLFTGVQNPFIITKYSGLDPEFTGGNDQTIYPRQRQILFGANVKF